MSDPSAQTGAPGDERHSCPLCGFVNLADARFCSGCGSHLSSAQHDATQMLRPVTPDAEEALGVEPPAGPELVVVSGHRAGLRWPVGGWRVTVGRHAESDVFLDDITVSRRHVELRSTSNGYELHDVGSLNGTYLNDERIAEPHLLKSGDRLRVGKFLLQYQVPTEAS